MSLDDLHMTVVDGSSRVPYISEPPSAFVSHDSSIVSTSGLQGDALFRDLIAFVNPGSGGRQGPTLIRDLGALIGSDRVFTMGKVNGVMHKPIDYLQKVVPGRKIPLRVVVCGGDGSVAWVISDADQLAKPHSGIQVFIIPLGTGNDLARAMLCGGGYTGRNVGDLRRVLQRCLTAEPVQLDRWQLCFEPSIALAAGNIRRRQVFNYFSLGVDARIAHRFHQARESNPHFFCAQSVNQLMYGCCACRQFCDCLPPVDSYVDLYVDGQILDLPYSFKVCFFFILRFFGVHFTRLFPQGLIFLNIGSYAGGRRLWQHTELPETHISDSQASAFCRSCTRIHVFSLPFRTVGNCWRSGRCSHVIRYRLPCGCYTSFAGIIYVHFFPPSVEVFSGIKHRSEIQAVSLWCYPIGFLSNRRGTFFNTSR